MICLLGYLAIGLLVLLLAFMVLFIPLFYTAITRWAFAGGSPRVETVGPLSEPASAPARPEGESEIGKRTADEGGARPENPGSGG